MNRLRHALIGNIGKEEAAKDEARFLLSKFEI
jgi:hypothetical protein